MLRLLIMYEFILQLVVDLQYSLLNIQRAVCFNNYKFLFTKNVFMVIPCIFVFLLTGFETATKINENKHRSTENQSKCSSGRGLELVYITL